jgi:hypothetical protein
MDRVADGRKRVTQLVRERGQKLVLAPVSLLQRTHGVIALEEINTRAVLPISNA